MKNYITLLVSALTMLSSSLNAQTLDWDQIDGKSSPIVEGKLNGLNMGGYTYGAISQQGPPVSLPDECVQCVNFDCSIFLTQQTITGHQYNSTSPKELFLQKSKELKTSVLRFPGGTHSGWYHFYKYDDDGFYDAEVPQIAKGYGMNVGETIHLPNPYSYCQEDTKITIDSNYIHNFANYVAGLKQGQPDDYNLSITYVANILTHFKFPSFGLPLIGSCTSTCGRELSLQPMENYTCQEKFELSYEGNEELFDNNPAVYRFELYYKETQDAIEFLVDRLNLELDDVMYVELGNEYYNNIGFNSGYSFEKYGMSAPRYAHLAEIYSERLKCYFEGKISIKTGIVSKPNGSWQLTNVASNVNSPGLTKLMDEDLSGNGQTLGDVVDGVILHDYYTNNECSNNDDIVERFECIRGSFSEYIHGEEGVLKNLDNFKDNFPGKSIWLTEWNIVGGDQQQNVDFINTAVHASFVQEFMLNLYNYNAINDNIIELANHHRIGFDLPWSVIQVTDGDNEIAYERASASPIKNLSEILENTSTYFHGNILEQNGNEFDKTQATVYAVSKENNDGQLHEVVLYYTNKTNVELAFNLPTELNGEKVISGYNSYTAGDYMFSYGPSNDTHGRNRFRNGNNVLYNEDLNTLGYGALHNSLQQNETQDIVLTNPLILKPNSTGIYKIQLEIIIGIEESQHVAEQIKLVPNPFTNYVTFEVSKEVEIIAIEVFNQNGQSTLISQESTQNNLVDTSDLLSGIYWCKITTNKGVVFKKGVKL